MNGSLDPSFGDGGIASLRVDPTVAAERAYAIALLDDERILLAGGRAPGPTTSLEDSGSFEAAQLLPDGNPDPTFGTQGRVTAAELSDPNSLLIAAQAVTLGPAGEITLAGSRAAGPDPCSQFTLLRLTPDGERVTGFGTQGLTETQTDCQGASDAVLSPSGRIVVTGSQRDGAINASSPAGTSLVAAYAPDGALDPSFGNGGMTAFRIDRAPSGLTSLALDGRGRIVAAGYVQGEICSPGPEGRRPSPCDALAVARLRPNGRLDRSFGKGGAVTDPKLCASPTKPPCVLRRHTFKRLVRRGTPRFLTRRGDKLALKIACSKRIDERCRLRAAVALRKRGRPIGSTKTIRVRAGRRRTAGIQPPAARPEQPRHDAG